MLKDWMIRSALRDANKARILLRQPPLNELLPGHPRSHIWCPISCTVKQDAPGKRAVTSRTAICLGALGVKKVPLSIGSRLFVRLFDRGFFKELDSTTGTL